jgi:hypothetical protein
MKTVVLMCLLVVLAGCATRSQPEASGKVITARPVTMPPQVPWVYISVMHPVESMWPDEHGSLQPDSLIIEYITYGIKGNNRQAVIGASYYHMNNYYETVAVAATSSQAQQKACLHAEQKASEYRQLYSDKHFPWRYLHIKCGDKTILSLESKQ